MLSWYNLFLSLNSVEINVVNSDYTEWCSGCIISNYISNERLNVTAHIFSSSTQCEVLQIGKLGHCKMTLASFSARYKPVLLSNKIE